MPSILRIMEQMAGAHEEALEKIVAPAEKDFLRICGNAERRIASELRRLTKSLSISPNELDIQLDIARTQATLSNVMRLHNEHIVNAGVDWATEYYPQLLNQSIEQMNEFKSFAGISLDTFADLDKMQIRVGLESWKGSLIQAGDSYKQFASKTITEHIMAGVGTKADLIKKLMDDDGLLPTSRMTRKTRAGWQARNELIRISRETNAIKDKNEKFFRMAGPVDVRASRCPRMICLKHVGFIKSRKEWLQISSTTFTYGLHFGCRHKWYAIRKEWLDDDELEAFDGNKRILYSRKDKDFIKREGVSLNILKLKQKTPKLIGRKLPIMESPHKALKSPNWHKTKFTDDLQREIKKDTKNHNIEFSYFVDAKTGKILHKVKGTKNSVKFDVLKMPDEPFINVHNHSNSLGFSPEDFRAFSHMGSSCNDHMVIGKDGSIFRAVMKKDHDGFLKIDNRKIEKYYRLTEKQLIPKYKKMLRMGEDKLSVLKKFDDEQMKLLSKKLHFKYYRYIAM